MAQRSTDPPAIEAEIERIRSLGLDALRARWRSMVGAMPPMAVTRRALKGASNPSRRRGRFLARLFYIAPYKESVRSQGSAGNNSEQHPHGKILPSRRSAYSP